LVLIDLLLLLLVVYRIKTWMKRQ